MFLSLCYYYCECEPAPVKSDSSDVLNSQDMLCGEKQEEVRGQVKNCWVVCVSSYSHRHILYTCLYIHMSIHISMVIAQSQLGSSILKLGV